MPNLNEMNHKQYATRLASVVDFDTLLGFHIALSGEKFKEPDALRDAIEDGRLLVATINGVIVGYISWEYFDELHYEFPESVFLSELFVEEGFRKQGVGKDLVQSVLNISYQEHFEYFSLTHDPHEKYLTKFYESFGFILNGATRAGNVRMIKSRKIIAY